MKRAKRQTTLLILALVLVIAIAPSTYSQKPIDKTKGIPPGWSDDINLSNDVMGDGYCSIAANNETVFVVWEHTYVSSADWEIVYSISSDGGNSWSPFVNISNSNWRVTNPDIDIFRNNVHVVWEDREGADRIDYRNSTDGGQSWNPIKRISSNTGALVAGPLIFVNQSNIHIIWYDQRDGTDGEIYYRRSLDEGITFDNGQGVDEDRRLTFSPTTIGNIAFAGSGSNLSIIWSDERNGIGLEGSHDHPGRSR